MPRYRITCNARKVGALGLWSQHVVDVDAPDREAAKLKLYESPIDLEHITVERIELVSLVEGNRA